MFRVVDAYECEAQVTVMPPGAEPQPFTARFRLGADDLDALADPDRAADAIACVWIGWSDVVDEDGKPVPFSPEMRDRLLKYPFVRAAVVRALATVLGRGGRGNSSAA